MTSHLTVTFLHLQFRSSTVSIAHLRDLIIVDSTLGKDVQLGLRTVIAEDGNS